MENQKPANSDRFKNAICYIPFVAMVLFFTEQNKSSDLMKHIKYWVFLLIAYILLRAFLWWLLWGVLFIVYAWISIVLWYKAYNWENVDIEYIDDFEKRIKDNYDEKK